MGKRVAGKPKQKSIKSKAINKNSKRKLDVFGKKQKKGYAGEAVLYMSRAQALRKLDLSLKDFRRICILKGIYPRDPKKKPNASQTYYHVKDISYIANEPIIDYFRHMKSFLKKISRAHTRNETSEAQRKWENMPEMSLDHLVKERYPTFASALTDLDDALSTVHLFALLPAKNEIRAKRTATCQRLIREWDMYVIKSKSLRKCFISIKGIYYQAEVMGEKITWLVPHKFSQELPTDVDYKVMLTFLDFYEVLLGFVLFRLYSSLGLKYPPAIDRAKDEEGSWLYSVKTEAAATEEEKKELAEEEAKSAASVAAMKQSLQSITSLPVPVVPAVPAVPAVQGEEEYQLDEAFAEDEEARALLKKQRDLKQFTSLFANKVFFLSREVPRESVEFVILCFGGKIGWEGSGSPFSYTDSAITHVIMDRPSLKQPLPNRDYVQPQWVFDSVNNGLLLPVAKYVPGQSLPPHLSPFVNNEAEGYTPEYQKEIDRLKSGEAEAEEEKKEEKVEDGVTKFAKEIEMEEKPTEVAEKEEEKPTKKEVAKKEEEEEKERKLAMVSKRNQRLYEKMEKEEKDKEKKIANLKKKAKKAKQGKIEKA